MLQPGKYFNIRNIMLLALLLRVTAAVFSLGHGWYDDHFGVIEVAQSWVDGKNIGGLIPPEPKEEVRQLSLFYPGVHFLLFKLMHALSINDPQTKMLFVRLLHALYSLLVVYYGYKIAGKFTDERGALWVALLLAAAWFMPNLSVRNLIEMVCVPPLLAGCYLLLKDNNKWAAVLMAGFISGFAFSIRYQAGLFIAGMALVLFIEKKWLATLWFSMGVLINVLIFQGITDCIFWGYPLAKFMAYVRYNIVHQGDFITGHWFNYPLLVSGMLIPPLSIMLWYGYFKQIRKHLLLFLPSFIFLLFHCYFKNKQERFILSFVPWFIILGTIGWYNFQAGSEYWRSHAKRIKGMVVFAAVINTLLLCVATVASTQTSTVDAMTYLYKRGDVSDYIVEGTDQPNWEQMPRFYLGKWSNEYNLKSDYSAAQLKHDLQDSVVKPNYVIFVSNENVDNRIAKFKADYCDITYLATIQPSFIDRLFYWLNPINRNTVCYVYKIRC